MSLHLLQINISNCGQAEMMICQFYETMKGCLKDQVGSALDHRSLPPIFQSLHGHI